MNPFRTLNLQVVQAGQYNENPAVIAWIYFMIFSYFIVVPLGTLSSVAVTDFRLYDLTFFLGFLFILLPKLRLVLSTIQKTKWLRYFFLFCLWIGFSIVMVIILKGLSFAIIAAARVARFIAYGLVAASIITFVKNHKTLYKLVWFFFILSVAEGWLSLFQFYGILPNFFPERWSYYGMMPTGTLGPHHLQMGVVCAMAICIGISLAFYEKLIVRKIFIGISIGVLFFATFAVESRSGWMGIALGVLYLAFRMSKRITWNNLFMISSLGIGIFLFFNYAGPAAEAQIRESFDFRFSSKLEEGGVESLSPTRIALVKDIPEIIVKYPWVLVTGTGTQNSVSVLTYGNALHNNYLHVLVEGGLIGLVLYIGMLVSIWQRSVYISKNTISKFSRLLSLGFQASFLVVLFVNFFNEAFYFQYATFSLSGQILALVALSLNPAWIVIGETTATSFLLNETIAYANLAGKQ